MSASTLRRGVLGFTALLTLALAFVTAGATTALAASEPPPVTCGVMSCQDDPGATQIQWSTSAGVPQSVVCGPACQTAYSHCAQTHGADLFAIVTYADGTVETYCHVRGLGWYYQT